MDEVLLPFLPHPPDASGLLFQHSLLRFTRKTRIFCTTYGSSHGWWDGVDVIDVRDCMIGMLYDRNR
jgi:hypothetical protein